MKTSKILSATLLAIALLISQVGPAFAASAVPDEADKQHPVAAALADYFKDITDYDTIMQAHAGEGDFEIVGSTGFGVITQALWATKNLGGDSADFLAILLAKKTGNYEAFEDLFGDVPQNWGQFRKAIKSLPDFDGGKKNNLGTVMSQNNEEHGNNGGGGGQNHSGGGGQNHGGGGGQGQGGGQGHGGGQGSGNLKP